MSNVMALLWIAAANCWLHQTRGGESEAVVSGERFSPPQGYFRCVGQTRVAAARTRGRLTGLQGTRLFVLFLRNRWNDKGFGGEKQKGLETLPKGESDIVLLHNRASQMFPSC